MIKAGKFTTIGTQNDFKMRIGKVVIIEDKEIAVFRTSDGCLFALDNRNPHPKGGPLAEGIVSGHYLYDPLYDWRIDLETGNVQAPDQGKVQVYEVNITGEEVQISL